MTIAIPGHRAPTPKSSEQLMREKHAKEINDKNEKIAKLEARITELEDLIVEFGSLSERAAKLFPKDMERYYLPTSRQDTRDEGAPFIAPELGPQETEKRDKVLRITSLNQLLSSITNHDHPSWFLKDVPTLDRVLRESHAVLRGGDIKLHRDKYREETKAGEVEFTCAGFCLPPTDPKHKDIYRVVLTDNKNCWRGVGDFKIIDNITDGTRMAAEEVLLALMPKQRGMFERIKEVTLASKVELDMSCRWNNFMGDLKASSVHIFEFQFKNPTRLNLMD